MLVLSTLVATACSDQGGSNGGATGTFAGAGGGAASGGSTGSPGTGGVLGSGGDTGAPGTGGSAGSVLAGAGGSGGDGSEQMAAGGVSGGSGGAASGTGGAGSMTGADTAGAGGSGGAAASGSGGLGADGTGGSPDAGMDGMLAATPPMGWNSWNTFQCNLNEMLIKDIADTLVSSGMQAVGYEYVNMDDCWMDGRDANGELRWNSSKFPSGIPALADYVHSKGLKLGIYETPNTTTCVGLYGGIDQSVAVGSLGHETADAQTFASWGIDYLKYDKCQGQLGAFSVMRDALRATGRPIFYSINPGDGTGCAPNTCSIDLPTIANMWRIGFDIGPNWSSVVRLIDENAELYSFVGPGHWNDPDMMEVGNGLNDTEGRAHFSMWAVMAAPLIAGNDLRSMSPATNATLTNAEVIAVDQDPLGVQGRLVASPGNNLQVWSKTLSGTNSRAVVLLNRNDAGNASITVPWSALGIPAGAASVRDLWSHTDLGTFQDSYTSSSVPGHGAVMLKVTASP